jgi:carboxynorspermidine decarboxylase
VEADYFGLEGFRPEAVPSPCFVVDKTAIRRNLAILDSIQKTSGARILLAQKGFSMFSLYPMISQTLKGVCASGLYEAKLGREAFGKEVHTYSPAFVPEQFETILELSDHVVFNSFSQWKRFRSSCLPFAGRVSCGIRVNPEVSTAAVRLYDPSAPGSRLGVTAAEFRPELLDGIEGLHFHALCEQNADDLERVLKGFHHSFGTWAGRMRWINFGGGHHITRNDYDRALLCRLIEECSDRYGVDVYLEPGEAVALNSGVLVATVLDIVRNDGRIALLDTSAATHMPDVLEMPYRPEIAGAGKPGEKRYTYRLGGSSCLAGDVIGTYSFDTPLEPGSRLVFGDMAHYSMVKTTTFNGVPLPAIATYDSATGTLEVVKQFGFEDFRERLS